MLDNPEGAYIPAVYSMPQMPKLTIQLVKLDNGYVVKLQEAGKKAPRAIAPVESPFVGLEPDQIIDKLVDGVGAMLRSINDAGAGEDWKGSDNRAQMREAFKLLFPDMARHAEQLARPEDHPSEEDLHGPRHESNVFESKESLIEYLKKNL